MLAVADEEDGTNEGPTRRQHVDKKRLCASFVAWVLLGLVILQMKFKVF